MCGIVGYINTDSVSIDNTSRILSMLKVQKHRGPDDSGLRAFSLEGGKSDELKCEVPVPIKGNFEGILGFNRLSILDLSLNGHQPMVSPDEKVILALNGEIYNAFEYKKELIEWGYDFRSTTDTEVALALYLKFGFEGMQVRLNGMFAIVVVDLRKGEMYITRDRFGIKPMYYVSTENTLAFSSELKCFKFLPDFRFELNHAQLDEHLLFRNNLKGTLYEGINLLEPGHYLTYSKSNGVVIKQYFRVNDYTRITNQTKNLGNTGKELESWLEGSVKSQLMSDVKLGCQLSGGIDSSLVTLLANKTSQNGNFESVSIVFDDKRFSEEQYIDHVRDQLKIKAHKFKLDSEYYLDSFEDATWHLESPINHPNTIGIYRLSQRAKEHVTVLLSGEGADEVFGGYSRFYSIKYPFGIKQLLHVTKKNLKSPQRILDYLDHENRAVMATSYMTPEMAKLLKSNFDRKEAVFTRKSMYRELTGSLFDKQVKYEMKSYLPDLLIRQDKMSMAHSIENRVPFLDNDLVSNSFLIPEKHLLIRKSQEGYNTNKYLLKKITANTFGSDFAFRDKMGFGIPLREFFTMKRFNEYLNDKILPGIIKRGLFNKEVSKIWVSNINRLNYQELEALWVMIAFETWAIVYLDSEYTKA